MKATVKVVMAFLLGLLLALAFLAVIPDAEMDGPAPMTMVEWEEKMQKGGE